jgi:farnesyl-diphosphate farnesyltransferase
MADGSNQLLTSILREVSRSFYLTLRILPSRIPPQIGLAYLLARMADTIADTQLLPVQERLSSLQALRERIEGVRSQPVECGAIAGRQGSAAEQVLLDHCEAAIQLLQRLAPADRGLVRDVLRTITSGQELDLLRFDGASARHVIALRTDSELDDYTYRVAGCVGEFWTKICRAHLFPDAPLNETELLAKGVRFGKGLQLVNILRDLPKDLRQGRCYLPQEELVSVQLMPAELLDAKNEPVARPLYEKYLTRAEANLEQGWSYTNALPQRCFRVRLACAWPVLIGLDTIRLLRRSNVLASTDPIKISRRRVKQLMWRSVLYYPLPAAWRSLGNRLAGAR